MNEFLTQYLKQAAEGDKDAFSEFAKNVSKRILAVAYRVTGDSVYAEDVLSIVLVKVWEKLGKIAALKNPVGYVNTMAYNAAIDFKRRQRELPLWDALADAEAVEPELKMDLETALFGLTPEEREIVLYHVHAKLSFRKIAILMNSTKKAVYLRYKKAIGKMREFLTNN